MLLLLVWRFASHIEAELSLITLSDFPGPLLRVARAGGRTVEPDPPAGRIIIRAEEDQRAFDDYVAKRAKLEDRSFELNNNKVFFDVDLASAYRDALGKISEKILDEFRRRVRNS